MTSNPFAERGRGMDHEELTRKQRVVATSIRRVTCALVSSVCWSACVPGIGWDPSWVPTDWGSREPDKGSEGAAGSGETPSTPKPDGEQVPSRGRLEPKSGETCYEFKTHGSATSIDDSPFEVAAGADLTEQFYF